MKKILFITFAVVATNFSFAQTNKLDPSGNAGIGTTSPNAPLQINGTNNGFTGGRNALALNNTNGKSNEITFLSNGTVKWEIGNDYASNGTNDFYLYKSTPTGYVPFYVNADNYVGIGTTSPDAQLAVNGKIHAQEIKVDMNGWPDYVFKSSYKLPSLANIRSFIDQNGHLPGVPSAAVVDKEGVNLGEMNKVLLKKVEELTLYLMEKDNQVETQRKLVAEQSKRLEQQEARLIALEEKLSKQATDKK